MFFFNFLNIFDTLNIQCEIWKYIGLTENTRWATKNCSTYFTDMP